jgi:ABC-type dipeptide/oligopeptide/nickel transport system permease subunit
MSDQKKCLEQPTRDLRLVTNPGLAMPIPGTGFGLIGDGLAQALRPRG